MKRLDFGVASDAMGLSGGSVDFCTREGAERIRAQIQAYWRCRGLEVSVNLLCAGFHPAIRAARYDVRSDMINGMPKPAPTRVSGVPTGDAPALDIEREQAS
jgi:hypothetical protein